MHVGAVSYAENELQVHAVHDKAIEARDELSQMLSELADMRKDRRQLELDLEMLELEIATDEKVKHPEMSATAMKEHLKAAYYKDERWRGLKQKVVDVCNSIEDEEADRRLTEKDIEIAVARMNELAGYLFYLGSVKYASVGAGRAVA